MTLTNKQSREAAGKINEDVDLHEKPTGQYLDSIARGQNVRLPSGQILSPEAQIMLDKSIVARNFATPASSNCASLAKSSAFSSSSLGNFCNTSKAISFI